jgi:hypothetical protein
MHIASHRGPDHVRAIRSNPTLTADIAGARRDLSVRRRARSIMVEHVRRLLASLPEAELPPPGAAEIQQKLIDAWVRPESIYSPPMAERTSPKFAALRFASVMWKRSVSLSPKLRPSRASSEMTCASSVQPLVYACWFI